MRQEAEQLRLERELILMTSTTSLTPPASSQNQSNHMSNIQSASTSSTSSTIDQLDAGYGTMNDQQEFDSFKKCFNSSENLINSQQSYDNNSQRKFQINVVNKYSHQQQPNWVQEEAEQERMTQKFMQNSRNFGPETLFDQKLRRSTPNLLLDYNNQISLKNSNSNSYINNRLHDAGYMNPVVTSTTMTRIQPIQQTSQPQQKVRIVNNVLNNTNKSALPLTKSRHSNLLPPQNTSIYISAKPPQPNNNHRLITSTSQGDLKNTHKLYSPQHQLKNHPFPIQSKCPMSTTNTQPPISLNQKCSNCSSVLGQGSAMFIEKLGLAFHLKCFRCSVCNIPLGNGKEGTDVRVSGANRLHCNNCFSNDLGNHIEINLVNNSQNNSFFSLNNLNNDEENDLKFNNQNCNNNNFDNRTSDDISYNIGNRITNYYDVLISSFSKKHIQLKSKLFDQHFILPNYFATKTNLSPPNVATSTSSSLSPHIINIQHF